MSAAASIGSGGGRCTDELAYLENAAFASEPRELAVHGSEEQLGRAAALLACIEQAHESAAARLTEATLHKRSDVELAMSEMHVLGGDATPRSMFDAVEDTATVQRWAEVLSDDDAEIADAEAVAARTSVAARRAQNAFQLQQQAAERRALAQRQGNLLRIAQDRYNTAAESASKAERAAADAASTLLFDEASGKLLGSPDEENRLEMRLQQRSPNLWQSGSSGGGIESARSFESLLHSPRTISLGAEGRVRGPSGRIYREVSCMLCLPSQWPRSWAILLVESRWFDPLILLTILCNCLTMAWESPLDPCCTPKAHFIDVCEWVYLGIFTVEMVLKIIAYGFLLHSDAYLLDPWCKLDFVVVNLAWLPIFFPSFGNYSVVRSFRALRPLRALKRVPGMPVLVQWILDVLPKMGNVLMLCGFVFLVFGIVGMELFKGSLHYRCALPGFEETPGHPSLDLDASPVLAAESSAAAVATDGHRLLKGSSGGVLPSRDPQAPYDTGISCNPSVSARCMEPNLGLPSGTTCAYFDSDPRGGIESFDSIPRTFIIFMQAITFDDWARPMLDLDAALSPNVWIYFVLIVVLGGFFVVNLFLAVIFLEFAHAQEELADENAADGEADASPADGEGGSAPLLSKSALRSDGRGHGRSAPFPPPAAAPPRGGRRHWWGAFLDCPPPAEGWRHVMSVIANSDALSAFATFLVLLNIVLMCMPYYGMSDEYAATVEFYTTVITLVFIAEFFVKIVGLGCVGYWSDRWNILDGSIVIMSMIEMLLTWVLAAEGFRLSFLRMLRMLRVLRMLRLMKSWKGLYTIVTTFIKAIPQMTNIAFLLLLISFIFSLLGTQIFGGIYNEESGYSAVPCPGGGACADGTVEKPRMHFDYCGPSMISIFVVLTGEWVDAMEPATALLGPAVSLFFIAVVIVGKYMLMNLLISVILAAFSEQSTEEMDETRGVCEPSVVPFGPHAGSHVWQAEVYMSSFLAAQTPPATFKFWTGQEVVDLDTTISFLPGSGEGSMIEPIILVGRNDVAPWPADHALFCFSRQHPLRRYCRWLVQQPIFDHVIIFVILLSSICLALDTPRLDPTSELTAYLRDFNLLFTLIFFLEMCCKVVAFGFAFGRDAYLHNPWNQLDFCIVVISLLVLLAEAIPQLRGLRVLRMMRVLRPLRAISRNAGMKLIITTLFRTLPAVSNVFAVVLAFQLVFCIVGMQLFAGTMASCSDALILSRDECLGLGVWASDATAMGVEGHRHLSAGLTALERCREWAKAHGSRSCEGLGGVVSHVGAAGASAPLLAVAAGAADTGAVIGAAAGGGSAQATTGRTWTNLAVGSFDSFGDAMRLLYTMSSGDEWETSMYRMMDATSPGHAPERNDFSPAAIFAVGWMFVGYIFAMNLVVGVVVEDFSRKHKEEDGAAIMTPAQQQWVATMQSLVRQRPQKIARPPKDGFRRRLFTTVTSQQFDAFITSVIVANILLMSCDYWGIDQAEERQTMYELAMIGFACVYYVECAVKITALGVDGYFGDAWCRFDFFLVCVSLVDQFATELLVNILPMPPMLLRVLRVFRILRILRLLKGAKELRDLIITMVLSLPSLLNVGALLALIIFIYSVLGVQLFTFLTEGSSIDDERNFHSIGSAAMLLFQCLTGDGWSSLMADAMVTAESGSCSEEMGDCGSVVAVPYFISFQLVGSFIFLNLVVAVILENFSTLHNTNPSLVSSFDLEAFQEAWAVFDPDATNFVPSIQLPEILLAVPRPLGLKGQTERQAEKLCLRLGLPQYRGMVSYSETLNELIEHNYFRARGLADLGGTFDHQEFRGQLEEVQGGVPLKMPKVEPPTNVKPSGAMRLEPQFVQSAGTVAQAFACKEIGRQIDRAALDRWRLRSIKRKTEGLKGGPSFTPAKSKSKDGVLSGGCLFSLAGAHKELARKATAPTTPGLAPSAMARPNRAPPTLLTPNPAVKGSSSTSFLHKLGRKSRDQQELARGKGQAGGRNTPVR